jgi:hypothetical protein
MPLLQTPTIPSLVPIGALLKFTGDGADWFGKVRAVSISANRSDSTVSVRQTLTVVRKDWDFDAPVASSLSLARFNLWPGFVGTLPASAVQIGLVTSHRADGRTSVVATRLRGFVRGIGPDRGRRSLRPRAQRRDHRGSAGRGRNRAGGARGAMSDGSNA